jgi:predicted dinucleotide-binding enzyme
MSTGASGRIGIIGAGRLGRAMARTGAARRPLRRGRQQPWPRFAADVLASDPHGAGGRRVIFFSGDHADAKKEVVALFEDAGFAAVDLSDLAIGGEMQQIHHPLAGRNLIRP